MSSAPAKDSNTVIDPDLTRLIALFDQCFYDSYSTRLIKGDDEPVYLPADENCSFNRIVFAHGFFASALHEIAHWCIAGPQRRQQVDFGYWYEPDGRTVLQQQAFESVEVKPQALEWIFSQAAGRLFRISVDNLGGETSNPEPFKDAVYQQVLSYCSQGLSSRQQQFVEALEKTFGTESVLSSDNFHRTDL